MYNVHLKGQYRHDQQGMESECYMYMYMYVVLD